MNNVRLYLRLFRDGARKSDLGGAGPLALPSPPNRGSGLPARLMAGVNPSGGAEGDQGMA